MILALVALSHLSGFTFPGGSIQSLVHSLSSATGRDCIAEIYDGDQKIGAFHCHDDDVPSLNRVVLKISGYRVMSVGNALVLTTGFVSPTISNFRSEKKKPDGSPNAIGVDSSFRQLSHLDSIRFAKGKAVTLVTSSKEALRLTDLYRSHSLPIRWRADTTFADVPFAVSVNEMDPDAFLKALARAAGCRVTTANGLISLELSGADYKKRFKHSAEDPVLMNMLEVDTNARGHESIASARLKFRKEAIEQISDADIEKSFSNPPQNPIRINFDASTSELKTICYQFGKRLLEINQEEWQEGTSKDPETLSYMRHLNKDSKPSYFMFRAPSEFYISFKLQGMNLSVDWG